MLTYCRDLFKLELTDSPKVPKDGKNANAKAIGWLLNPRYKLNGAKPEKRNIKHLFLYLDSLADKIIT